jgi:hypothetical protein
MKTLLKIQGSKFLINGQLTYSELKKCPEKFRGMLMNLRMIQGVFDDKQDPARFNRFGKIFDADGNTNQLITALPEWYRAGIRAITVGFQGGGPCFTLNSYTIDNNPFSEDGSSIDEKYLNRMKRIIDAADRIGMAVIVCMFYGAQSRFLKDDDAVFRAVKSVSNWARDNSFTNVILEIVNEHDVDMYHIHPILYLDTGIAQLLEVAIRESGGIPVGCSGTGKVFSRNIADKSDVVLIHGNDKTRQRLYDFIQKVKEGSSGKPVVINEDSQCIGNMMTAMDAGVSWGYYNNMTKQEPPCDYGITKGEDQFFAMRLSQQLGIADSEPPVEEQYYLQGLEKDMEYDGKRWIRLASLHPERIDKVILYRNNRKVAILYDEPFFLNAYGNSNWLQMPFEEKIIPGEKWKAEVVLADGRIITKETTAI